MITREDTISNPSCTIDHRNIMILITKDSEKKTTDYEQWSA